MITYLSLGNYGRLGNQLFQIAATIGFGKRLDHSVVFPPWQYKNHFNVNVLPIHKITPYGDKIEQLTEKVFTYDPLIQTLAPEKTASLFGYFQSEKYFSHCKQDIKNLIDSQQNVIQGIDKNNTVCAIHVRRGDYMNLQQHYIPLTDTYYYDTAVNYMKSIGAKTFIMFSDDILWCKERFKNNGFKFSEADEFTELMMMRACRYHIIANSSFSWWGSWNVNSNCVIAPKQWFGPAIPNDTKDLYRDDMIIL